MGICLYCDNDRKLTREHVYPAGVLELFPECDLSLFKGKGFFSDLTIKDVCEICNNGPLSKLDAYGKELISQYFIDDLNPADRIEFKCDSYLLKRWILKILYNEARASKDNYDWYYNNRQYLLGETYKPQWGSCSFFAGLYVNTSPVPDFWTGNLKLSITKNPRFIYNGILLEQYTREGKLYFSRNDHLQSEKFSNLSGSSILRIGSALFVVLLWNKASDQKEIFDYERIISENYPYQLFSDETTRCILSRATHAFNCHTLGLIDCHQGMISVDHYSTLNNHSMTQGSLNSRWKSHEEDIRQKANLEKGRFINNG